MSGQDASVDTGQPERSVVAVVALGVGATLVGFVVLPLFPFVVLGVLAWWLAEGLRGGADPRRRWLVWVALGVFALLATGVAALVTSFDAHFDCGGTLGGFGEAPDAQLDTRCRDDRDWRVIVGGLSTLVICAVGAVVVRRVSPGRSPLGTAAVAIGGMVVSILAVVVGLVVS